MASKKNQTPLYSSNTPKRGAVVVDTGKLVAGVAAALIVGGVGGALVTWRVSDLNSFRIDTNIRAITQLQEHTVDKDVYEINQLRLEEKIDDVKNDIMEIKQLLK